MRWRVNMNMKTDPLAMMMMIITTTLGVTKCPKYRLSAPYAKNREKTKS